MTFSQFKSKWLGKRVETDGIPKDGPYQCVDLIKEGLKEMYGIPYDSYGDAVDYWYKTAPAILKKFSKVSGSYGNAGDIVILKGINGNPYGHIGWGTGRKLPLLTEILEQNGHGDGWGVGKDAIRTRFVPTWRVVGLLRPKAAKPVLKMPRVGSIIHLNKGQTRTTFRAKTTKVAGHIRVTDNSFNYQVRGYDPVYGGRILINSKSGGGNGVALALYYTNGKKIDGWK
jgi:hypothetical protein